MHRPSQRVPDEPGKARGSPTPALSSGVLGLQRHAGNRAVGQIVARKKNAKQPGFQGDGKHSPTDVGYATEVGTRDAALLVKATSLSEAQRADIKSKLAWFHSAARDAYLALVKPPLVKLGKPASDIDPAVQTDYILERTRMEKAVDNGLGAIQKLQWERIDVWEKNARIPDSKLALEVLEFVVAVVSDGLGGVALKLIDDALEHRAGKFMREFASLAGLEATDYSVEGAYRWAVSKARADIDIGTKNARDAADIKKTSKDALASKGDTLAAYTEALKLHTIREESEQKQAFSTSAAALSDDDVVKKVAALQVIYDQLAEHPDAFLQELTDGFLTMLDEAMLREEDKDYGGDRARTFRESREAHEGWMRAGNLVLDADRSLGRWPNPDLGFSELKATAGGLNSAALDYLQGTELQQLEDDAGLPIQRGRPIHVHLRIRGLRANLLRPRPRRPHLPRWPQRS